MVSGSGEISPAVAAVVIILAIVIAAGVIYFKMNAPTAAPAIDSNQNAPTPIGQNQRDEQALPGSPSPAIPEAPTAPPGGQ